MIKVKPNKQKAESVMNMARITLERLNEVGKEKYPSKTLTDYYDIIHGSMEALMSIEGLKITGKGAHQKIIDFVCKRYKLGKSARLFVQELRKYRNKISYEGFMIKKEFIERNSEKINKIIEVLIKLGNEGVK